MMTSSNGNIFRVTGSLCGEFTGPGEFPTQRPVTRSFDVFFDLRLNKRLSKQSWGWWFETPSWSLWRHCNENWRYGLLCSMIHPTGPLFTKRTNVLPQDLAKSRSREIGCYHDRIFLKFDRHLGSTAAEVPVKIQSDWGSLNPDLAALRSCGKTSVRLVNRGPASGPRCVGSRVHAMLWQNWAGVWQRLPAQIRYVIYTRCVVVTFTSN